MKIKRIAALILCVVLSLTVLVGCETAIGQYYWDVYKPNNVGVKEEKPEVKLDFYIITEYPENYDNEDVAAEHNSDLATVEYNINLHLADTYRTTLDIHFISEDKYAETIKTATSGIVLINSESLMKDMLAQNANAFVDLTAYLASDEYEFGTLNVQIASTLLEAARETTSNGSKLYCIPNNHVVGSYDYIAVNKDVAAKLHYGKNDIAKINTAEAAEAFASVAQSNWDKLGIDGEYSKELVVRDDFTGVGYGYTHPDAPSDKWEYIVSAYPVVTKAEAYGSAYSILSGTENPDRAMEIIYALNTDVEFRNLLQYGVLNNDYEVDNTIESDDTHIVIKDTLYKMNILYTGDVFKAYYNSDYWTKDMALAGKIQNAESVLDD